MNEEKKKRVFSAVLAGLIMFTTILVAILVYQLAGILIRKNKIEKLDAEINALRQEISQTEEEIDEWSKEWKIIERARELGLYFEDEEE